VQQTMRHHVRTTASSGKITYYSLCFVNLPALQADMVSHKDKLELLQSLDNRFARFLVHSRDALLRVMMVSFAAVVGMVSNKRGGKQPSF